MSENEYIIDTSLDSGGVVKGAEEINKALDDSSKHAENASKSIKDVDKALSEFDTSKLENEGFKKQIEAMREQARLAEDIANMPKPSATNIAVDTEGATDFTKQTDALEGNAKRITSIKTRIVDALDSIAERFYRTGTNNGEMLGNTFSALAGTVDNFGKTTKRVFAAVGGGAVKGAIKGVKSLAKAYVMAHQSAKQFRQSHKLVNGGLQGGFKTFLKYGLGIRSLFVLVNRLRNALKEGFTNLAKFDKDTNASISSVTSALATLKNALATAFAPILNVVAPILTSFINKLVAVANAIGAVLAKLTGKNSYAKAIAVQKDFAASLDKTGKSAKGQTLAIDELNQSVDETESGGGGGGGAGDMFENADITEAQAQMADWLKSMWENADFTELGTAVGTKLAEGLDKIPWDGIKQKSANIGKSIATFINGFVEVPDLGNKIGNGIAQSYNTAFKFAKSFVKNLHWESIGSFIGDGVMGFLENINIGDYAGTIGGIVQGLFDTFTGFMKAIDWQGLPILLKDKFVEAVRGVDWGGVASSMAKALGTALASVGKLLVGVGQLILDIVKSIKDYFAQYIDDYINKTGSGSLGWAIINGVWNGITDALKNVGQWIYNNIFKPFIEGFQEAFKIHSPSKVMEEQGNFIVDGLYDGLVGVWNKVRTIFENLKTNIINKTIEIKNGAKQKFTEMKDNIISIVTILKDNTISRFTTMKNSVISVVTNLHTDAKNVFTNIKNKIDEIVTTIKANTVNRFSSMKEDVIGVFSEVKNRVVDIVEGLKNALRTPINGIISFFEAMLNGIADGINGVVDKIKAATTFSFTNPITKEHFSTSGVSLPKVGHVSLPRLATGTVIPRQAREFAAILGDNNRETEVVSPLSTIQEAVAEALTPYLAEIARNTEKFLDKDFTTYVGDREVAKAAMRGRRQLGYQISQ